VEAQIIRNLPLNFLYDDWYRVSKALLRAPFRETTVDDPCAWPQRNKEKLSQSAKCQAMNTRL